MKKAAAELIFQMANKNGNVLFNEPEFCSLYRKADKYLYKLKVAKIKRLKKCGAYNWATQEKIENMCNEILN